MLERMDIAFGMRHQAKDVATGIADTRDIAHRAVRIVGIRHTLPIPLVSGCIDKGNLSVGLQYGEVAIENELAFAMRNGQLDGLLYATREDTHPRLDVERNPATLKLSRTILGQRGRDG